MRKNVNQILEDLNQNGLKRYLKMNVSNFKYQLLFLIPLLIVSCSVHNQINKDDYCSIPRTFSASFYDQLDTIHYKYDNRFETRSLMKNFTDKNNIDYSKSIQLQIVGNQLCLKFCDTNKKEYVLKFFGKYAKRKFVFYTNYETISFPILFIRKEMTKYTIYLANKEELIIENNSVNEGMLLFFGAGNASCKDYKFKLLKNE